MATKLTFNGVTYDNVEALPPEARKLYDQILAQMPALEHRDGNAIPDILGGGGPLSLGTTVRQSITVNGTTYRDKSEMPPDVRQTYEQAMATASAAGPPIRKNEIKLSFQMSGPGLKFHVGPGTASGPQGPSLALESTKPTPIPDGSLGQPIEPSSGGAASRIALFLAVAAAISIAVWLWVEHH